MLVRDDVRFEGFPVKGQKGRAAFKVAGTLGFSVRPAVRGCWDKFELFCPGIGFCSWTALANMTL